MPDVSKLVDKAWTLHTLTDVLCAALPDDAAEALPVRHMIQHLRDLSRELALTIDAECWPLDSEPHRQALADKESLEGMRCTQ
ncbi:hypothetical protein [Caballeronia sp. BCC1704]|uniref:hypothetical protein n=1 Tax=Caballeronia sp. BCC1704 TaxID=2676300 RepID=UPI00158B3959|nr:hypothetical protein [Caballeronia sp. BCC1704]